MSKLRSEFHDCEGVIEKIDGSPIAEGEDAPTPSKVQVECVFKGRRPVAMYWVIDGVRVAYRGRNEWGPTWLPMLPNVTTTEDCFSHARVQ